MRAAVNSALGYRSPLPLRTVPATPAATAGGQWAHRQQSPAPAVSSEFCRSVCCAISQPARPRRGLPLPSSLQCAPPLLGIGAFIFFPCRLTLPAAATAGPLCSGDVRPRHDAAAGPGGGAARRITARATAAAAGRQSPAAHLRVGLRRGWGRFRRLCGVQFRAQPDRRRCLHPILGLMADGRAPTPSRPAPNRPAGALSRPSAQRG